MSSEPPQRGIDLQDFFTPVRVDRLPYRFKVMLGGSVVEVRYPRRASSGWVVSREDNGDIVELYITSTGHVRTYQ